jgi:hypothetical protein
MQEDITKFYEKIIKVGLELEKLYKVSNCSNYEK